MTKILLLCVTLMTGLSASASVWDCINERDGLVYKLATNLNVPTLSQILGQGEIRGQVGGVINVELPVNGEITQDFMFNRKSFRLTLAPTRTDNDGNPVFSLTVEWPRVTGYKDLIDEATCYQIK